MWQRRRDKDPSVGARTILMLGCASFFAALPAGGAEPPTTGFPAPTEQVAPAPAQANPAPTPSPAGNQAEPSPPPSAPPPKVAHVVEVPPPPAPPAPEPTKNVSVTLAPLLFLAPMLEAQVEVRLGPVGLAAFGGVGQVTVELRDAEDAKFRAYRLGAVAMAYPLVPFESLGLGAEVLYVHVSADDIGDTGIKGFASGVAIGPLIGYKTIGRTGFTFAVQGGVAHVVVHAEASDDSATEEEDDQSLIPLLNLNLGWSF
jgi:hypothetical protein